MMIRQIVKCKLWFFACFHTYKIGFPNLISYISLLKYQKSFILIKTINEECVFLQTILCASSPKVLLFLLVFIVVCNIICFRLIHILWSSRIPIKLKDCFCFSIIYSYIKHHNFDSPRLIPERFSPILGISNI